MFVSRRSTRLLLPLAIAIAVLFPLPPHALADITDGGGSSDFLLKTFVSGQSGPPDSLYCAGGWVNAGAVGGTATQAPAVVTYGQQFWVVVVGTDQQIWKNIWQPTSGWTGWSRLPYYSGSGGFTSAPAIAVYNNDVDVFVRGSNYDIWQSTWVPGTGWSGWTDITFPNQSASAPAVTPYTGNNDRNELQLWWLDASSSNMMQYVYNQYGGKPNAWSGPAKALCCYESAPAVTQFGSQLQVWGVGNDSLLYQTYSAPGTGWSGYATITNDVVGSAPSVTPYGSLFEVFYVMGDYTNTIETKQLVWDPNNGGWQAAVDFVDEQSAPAVTQFGNQLQV